MDNTKRYRSLDLVKTVAVICICALHFPWCGNIEYSVGMSALTGLRRFLFGFNACAVPLFMAVNGALLLNRPFDAKKHWKRTVLLFLQYLFWRAVTIILVGVYTGVDFGAYNLTTLVNALLLLKDFPAVNVNHLWFMPMLICIYVWLPFLRALFDKLDSSRSSLWYIAPFMLGLLVFCFLYEDFELVKPVLPFFNAAEPGGWLLFLPLSGTRYCSMLFYFLMGGLILKYYDRLRRIPAPVLSVGVLIGLVLLYLEWLLNSSYSGETYDNVFLSYDNLPCVLLCLGVFLLALSCEAKLELHPRLCAFLGFIGGNTMTVYYLHWILLSTVFEYLHFADGILFNLLKAAVLTLLCAGVGRYLKKLPVIRMLLH